MSIETKVNLVFITLILVVVLGIVGIIYGTYRSTTCYVCRKKPCWASLLVCADGGTFKVCRKCAERIRRDYMPKETE